MQNMLITDLQTQIESMHNTRDFEILINDIFTRINGTDYVASDYHGDEGMDGYIPSSKTLIAKHCFENPLPRRVNRNDEILRKAKGDLKKAIDLSKKLEIKKWMFVTAYLMPTPVYVKLKTEVEAADFEFVYSGPSFIRDVLIQNKDLLQNHPGLQLLHVAEDVRDIKRSVGMLITDAQLNRTGKAVEASPKPELEKKVASIEQQTPSPTVFKTALKKKKSRDYERLLEIYKYPPSAKLEKEIKSIIYSSSDQEAVLQGVHLLSSWYKYSRETIDDQLTLLDLGIDSAKTLKSLDSEAVLMAEKGSLLSTKFVLTDLEGWGNIQISNVTGFPLITKERKDAIIRELKSLNEQFNELFREAMKKAYASNNYLAVTKTFSRIGDAAGNRAGHYMSLGIKDRAIFEQRLSKSSFMHAKKIAAQFSDETEVAYVLYNFANALGFMSEADEALLVLKEAVEIAKNHKLNDILVNIERLEKLIKEPKIKLVNHD